MKILILMAFLGACSGMSDNPQGIKENQTDPQTYFGQFHPKFPRHCMDISRKNYGMAPNGAYIIYPYHSSEHPVLVYCDMETDGGGWTVIQRRDDILPRENFYRTWLQYALGFGKVEKEFWLGLNHIHALTDDSFNEVRFDLEDFEGVKRYAKYSFFHVDDRSKEFKVEVEGYSGDAGDCFSLANNMKFSTKDNENDVDTNRDCAKEFLGGWWYTSCHKSNLNGKYYGGKHESYADGINWEKFRGYHYSLKKTEIKIRPSYLL